MPLLAKTPEELFDYGTPDDIKTQYRKLASQHHPDKGGDAADFQLVKDLYEQALAKAESGAPWDTGRAVTWRVGDRSFTLKYRRRLDAGIGKAYAGLMGTYAVILQESNTGKILDIQFREVAPPAWQHFHGTVARATKEPQE
jgi:hypothetical protein